jgi:O-antigen ligase
MTVATSGDTPWLLRWPGKLMWAALAVVGSAFCALLIARGRWMFVLLFLAAVPVFLLVQRFPLAVMTVWFLILPFMTDIDDGGRLKLLYWAVHRMLPLAALVVLIISYSTGAGYRRLGRLGWAEVFMLGYLIASVFSVLYTSATPDVELRHLYDRVAVPMILYVLVRLIRPRAEAMKVMSYILLFIIVTQASIGLASWLAPGIVPDRFLTRAGERTTGTLDHANVFGIVSLAAGALFLHISRHVDDWRRRAGLPVFLLTVAMAILSFSRASWLAALVVVIGAAFAYPRLVAKASIVGALAAGVFLLTFGNAWVGDYLEDRLYSAESERSALSRLPVVYASLRMIEERPMTGWGYGRFDDYDIQFQSSVGDLFVPEKDHASHNLFLTIGAEQGLVVLGLYLAPAVYWLLRTPRAMSRLRSEGMFGRRLLILLWAVVAGHIVVSNFSNMKVSFGLAVWWLSLALIGNIVTDASSLTDSASNELTATGSSP